MNPRKTQGKNLCFRSLKLLPTSLSSLFVFALLFSNLNFAQAQGTTTVYKSQQLNIDITQYADEKIDQEIVKSLHDFWFFFPSDLRSISLTEERGLDYHKLVLETFNKHLSVDLAKNLSSCYSIAMLNGKDDDLEVFCLSYNDEASAVALAANLLSRPHDLPEYESQFYWDFYRIANKIYLYSSETYHFKDDEFLAIGQALRQVHCQDIADVDTAILMHTSSVIAHVEIVAVEEVKMTTKGKSFLVVGKVLASAQQILPEGRLVVLETCSNPSAQAAESQTASAELKVNEQLIVYFDNSRYSNYTYKEKTYFVHKMINSKQNCQPFSIEQWDVITAEFAK